jgi:hypothetical protein
MDLKKSCKSSETRGLSFEIFISTKFDPQYRNENQKIKNNLYFWQI